MDQEVIIKLIGFGAIISGFYCFWDLWRKNNLVKKSQSWQSVEGVVTHSEVVKKSSGGYQNRNHVYVANIHYEYSPHGLKKSNNTICIGGELNTSFKERAEERCRKYPLGSAVQVYYDPQNIDISCLEKRGEVVWFTSLIAGAAVLIGFIMLF